MSDDRSLVSEVVRQIQDTHKGCLETVLRSVARAYADGSTPPEKIPPDVAMVARHTTLPAGVLLRDDVVVGGIAVYRVETTLTPDGAETRGFRLD